MKHPTDVAIVGAALWLLATEIIDILTPKAITALMIAPALAPPLLVGLATYGVRYFKKKNPPAWTGGLTANKFNQHCSSHPLRRVIPWLSLARRRDRVVDHPAATCPHRPGEATDANSPHSMSLRGPARRR